MHDTQPPITDGQQYAGYQDALARMEPGIRAREQALIAALASQDRDSINGARSTLLHIYRRWYGILEAIQNYERQQKQAPTKETA